MFGLVANLHEKDALIDFAATWSGRIIVIVAASFLLAGHAASLLMIPAILFVSLMPNRRREILIITAVMWLVILLMRRQGVHLSFENFDVSAVGSVRWDRFSLQFAETGALVGAMYLFARHLQSLPSFVQRHPVLLIHVATWIMLVATTLPGFGALGISAFLSWRFCYLVMDVSRQDPGNSKLSDHIYYLFPIFGGTFTPFGKGRQYLERQASNDLRELAVSQLAGIKLLVLAFLWGLAIRLLDTYVFAVAGSTSISSGIPRLPDLMAGSSAATLPVLWASLYLELIRITLGLAALGHVTVGCLRLLGFNVFRNTYKPLLAQSIVEFWNRFYYYFKELLVQFFFYPVYLRSSRLSPTMRLVLAVFAAAFLGNMYFHLLVDFRHMLTFEFETIWAQWGPRLIYCFALAAGISISMLRQKNERKSRDKPSTLTAIRRIAGVWTFYSFIHIWAIQNPEVGYMDRIEFTLRFLGFT